MGISIWHLLPRMRARSRWLNRVERAAAECLPLVWSHLTPSVKSMSCNEAYGYLRAHASLHVTRRVGAEDSELLQAVIARVVQILEQRVHQPAVVPMLRRAA